MAGRFKASKYRHMRGKVLKKDMWFVDFSPSTTSDGQTIDASTEWLAVAWSSGNCGDIGIVPIDQVGKCGKLPAVVHGHGQQICDVQFSPHDPNLLASSADHSDAKVWRVPAGFSSSDASSLQPAQVLSHGGRRVDRLRWHPNAANVVATGGVDKIVKLWDVESGVAKLSLEQGGAVDGLTFSHDGTLLASATREDNAVSVWDPRASKAIGSVQAHDAKSKTQRVTFCGNLPLMVSSGFNKYRDREWAVWDPRKLDKALKRSVHDAGTTVMNPLYDVDTNVLFMSAKGDSNIRFFEISEAKHLESLNSISAPEGLRSFCLLPKLACDVMATEVDRAFGVGMNSVIPISFQVPRSSKACFGDVADLFPNTAAEKAALSAAEWFSGSDAQVDLVSVDPDQRGDGPLTVSCSNPNAPRGTTGATLGFSAAASSRTAAPAAAAASTSSAASSSSTGQKLTGGGWQAMAPKEEEKEEEVYVARKVKVVRSSNYRHIHGKPYMQAKTFQNLQPDCFSRETNPVAVSERYLATPWKGPGGRFAVVPLSKPGRHPDDPLLFECGSNIIDLQFDPFHPDRLATAGEDGHIKVWKITDDQCLRKKGRSDTNFTEPAVDLSGHLTKVNLIKYHPTVEGLLFSASGDGTMRLWDSINGKELLCMEGLIEDMVQDVSWGPDGSLIAVSTKDKKLKIIDPRKQKVIQEGIAHPNSAKSTRIVWMRNNNLILTCGFGRSSAREMSLFNPNDLSAPIGSAEQGASNSIMNPFYDPETGVAFLAGKGDGNVMFYEITEEAPYFHFLNAYRTSEPQFGIAAFSKRVVDVKKVEIFRMLKLTQDSAIPIRFLVPRTRPEFFQDDVYSPTQSDTPTCTATEWMNGASALPKLVSMRPPGMPLLSEAPVIERKAKYTFKPHIAPKEEQTTPDSVMSAHYDKMMSFKETNDAPVDQGTMANDGDEDGWGVDDEEWSD
eukprot:CAMPEP_0174248912 /NCGR_PEP_ID=MMETSP0417-20130205/43316_1 /TAXON_ID=242541 /ORGANISM="Mayorella sp, Strain BSH-02190019" /LENGTH=954 /DNA_ID=CAMNT_0015328779 /DNA_START=49 /DNA_END=2913 /DNA_ORIENTATION=+